MSEKEFIGGLIVKAPHKRAPEYVIARLSIKREELIAWLQTHHEEWINADIKESQNGKWYAQVDDWKPDGRQQRSSGHGGSRGGAPQRQRNTPTATPKNDADDFAGFDDDIPFITSRCAW